MKIRVHSHPRLTISTSVLSGLTIKRIINFPNFRKEYIRSFVEKQRDGRKSQSVIKTKSVGPTEKVNSKNKEFRLQLENIKASKQTSQLENEINKLNDIMNDIKDYA